MMDRLRYVPWQATRCGFVYMAGLRRLSDRVQCRANCARHGSIIRAEWQRRKPLYTITIITIITISIIIIMPPGCPRCVSAVVLSSKKKINYHLEHQTLWAMDTPTPIMMMMVVVEMVEPLAPV